MSNRITQTKRKLEQIINGVEFENLELKLGYILVKPNGAKELKKILKDLKTYGFKTFECYVVKNYSEISKELWQVVKKKNFRKDIYEEKIFKKIYGNNGMLVFVGKENISHEKLVEDINSWSKDYYTRYKQFVNKNINDEEQLGEIFENYITKFIEIPYDNKENLFYQIKIFVKKKITNNTNEISKKEQNLISNGKTFKTMNKK